MVTREEFEQAIEILSRLRQYADAEDHNKIVEALDMVIEILKDKE
jgi:BMFP domain-containing protein YqiC